MQEVGLARDEDEPVLVGGVRRPDDGVARLERDDVPLVLVAGTVGRVDPLDRAAGGDQRERRGVVVEAGEADDALPGLGLDELGDRGATGEPGGGVGGGQPGGVEDGQAYAAPAAEDDADVATVAAWIEEWFETRGDQS